ncbi:hypothetical protein LCGC14_1998540, partial [marine sediment metagenome]
VTLVVTVDCGVSDHREVQAAREMGLDIIITDHHQLPDTMPEANAVVNPQREPENSALRPGGGLPVPYRRSVAFVSSDPRGSVSWRRFDGKGYSPSQLIHKTRIAKSAAATPEGTVFVATLAGRRAKVKDLLVARLDGESWKFDTIDDGLAGKIGPVALTAAGDRAVCFWVRSAGKTDTATHDILYRTWTAKTGWGATSKIAREKDPVHRIVTPLISPPDYAPVFWDKLIEDRRKWRQDYPWVRFARVPVGR